MTVRAVVVGSLTIEITFRVPTRPEPGQVIAATAFGTSPGGRGHLHALALVALGAATTLVGAVGTDPHGDAFLAALADAGVDARVTQLPEIATAVAAPLITPDGAVGVVRYPGANEHLDPDACRDLPPCDLLVLEGEVPAAASIAAAEVVRRRGGTVLLHAAPAPGVTTALQGLADVVVAAPAAAAALLGRGAPPADDPVALAGALRPDGGAAVVALGARGAAYASTSAHGIVAAPAVDADDWSTADEVLSAALGLALAEGLPLPDAAGFACAAVAQAAVLRTTPGGGLPTRDAVERLRSAG